MRLFLVNFCLHQTKQRLYAACVASRLQLIPAGIHTMLQRENKCQPHIVDQMTHNLCYFRVLCSKTKLFLSITWNLKRSFGYPDLNLEILSMILYIWIYQTESFKFSPHMYREFRQFSVDLLLSC